MKEIQLTQGKVALVDDEDFEWLNQWKWGVDKDSYAMREGPRNGEYRTTLKMHRLIAGLIKGDGMCVDHINGNKLDNRRENLRVCSRSENQHNQRLSKANTSGFKGVHFHKATRKWMARIKISSKIKYIGTFDTPEAAHEAYCKSAIALHGEFANFGHGCVTLEDNNVSR